MKTIFFLVIFIASMFTASAIAAKPDIPFLVGRVTDNAEIIKESTRRTLTERLKAHETGTGNQIAVLTVPTIGDESIEEYAVAVFESWKLGEKGKDNGVLIIVYNCAILNRHYGQQNCATKGIINSGLFCMVSKV